MKRLTADSFRNCGIRSFGFGDIHKGRMALEGFDFLKSTGANGCRAAIVPTWDGTRYTIPAQQITDLKWMMRECQSRGLYLFPVLATQEDSEHERLWDDPVACRSLVDCGLQIVRETRGRVVIGLIDILNEPKLFTAQNHEIYWRDFVAPMVAGAAQIDPKRVLAVEPWPGARVDTQPGWGDYWRPQPSNVVMSPHNYSPFGFTHNGMAWAVGENAQKFDAQKTAAVMLEELLYSVNVARKFDVPVWYGETSARQDMPGADEWARVTLAIFRGLGLSWNWHYLFGSPKWHPSPATLEILKAEFKAR